MGNSSLGSVPEFGSIGTASWAAAHGGGQEPVMTQCHLSARQAKEPKGVEARRWKIA